MCRTLTLPPFYVSNLNSIPFPFQILGGISYKEERLPAIGIAMGPMAFMKRAVNEILQICAFAPHFAIHVTETVQKVLEGMFRGIRLKRTEMFHLKPLSLEF